MQWGKKFYMLFLNIFSEMIPPSCATRVEDSDESSIASSLRRFGKSKNFVQEKILFFSCVRTVVLAHFPVSGLVTLNIPRRGTGRIVIIRGRFPIIRCYPSRGCFHQQEAVKAREGAIHLPNAAAAGALAPESVKAL